MDLAECGEFNYRPRRDTRGACAEQRRRISCSHAASTGASGNSRPIRTMWDQAVSRPVAQVRVRLLDANLSPRRSDKSVRPTLTPSLSKCYKHSSCARPRLERLSSHQPKVACHRRCACGMLYSAVNIRRGQAQHPWQVLRWKRVRNPGRTLQPSTRAPEQSAPGAVPEPVSHPFN